VPNAYATHAASRQIIVRDFNNICIIDYETGAIKGSIAAKDLGDNVRLGAAWIENANQILISSSSRNADGSQSYRFTRFDIHSGRPLAELSKPAHRPLQLVADESQSDLYAINQKGSVKRVRLNPSGLTVNTILPVTSAFTLHSLSGQIAYAKPGKNAIYLTHRDKTSKVSAPISLDPTATTSTIDTLFFSPDGKQLGVRTALKFYVLSVDTGEVAMTITFPNAQSKRSDKPGFFNRKGDLVVISQDKDGNRTSSNSIEKWIAYDTSAGQPSWEFLTSQADFIGLDASQDMARLFTDRVIEIDLTTGKDIKRSHVNNISYGSAPHSSVSTTDGTRFASATGGNEILLGSPEFTKSQAPLLNVFKIKSDGNSTTGLAFLADKSYLAATDLDGFIRLWNTQTKELIAKVALFESDAEWAITTPDNRFDIAPRATGLIYFVAGKEILSTDALYETYYTPKLLPMLLSGSELDPVPALSQQSIPPRVTLGLAAGNRGLFVEDDDELPETDAASVRLKAEAFSQHSTIDEIRLYDNGKLITTATRGLFVEDDELEENQAKTKEYTVNLVPGENIFVARAIDKARIEGSSKTFMIQAGSTTQQASASKGGIHLHIVAVGIDEYKNRKYNLNYAVADASAFMEKIERINTGLFTSITPHFIKNSEATAAGIINAFQAVKNVAGPRDVFIFYYAGHGVISETGERDFYLVPTDVTQLYGNDEQLKNKAVSSKQLLSLSKDITAQKQLFILDACQSAGALQAIAMRGAAEEKAIAQLARSTGTHWLTASGSEQFATEFAELGHGAFTYTLLNGLSGKADSGDGRVTVNELKAYLESEVPEVTEKYKGLPQYPSSYGYGQDFPVGTLP
jgi:WD40 repeat protein